MNDGGRCEKKQLMDFSVDIWWQTHFNRTLACISFNIIEQQRQLASLSLPSVSQKDLREIMHIFWAWKLEEDVTRHVARRLPASARLVNW